jgi:beta-phosphoglucomutase-like phosphatase (HAD superfamily)
MTHLVMFDVDGTLVDSEGFDGPLFVRAVREVVGVEVDDDWSSYPHATDSGLVSEVLRRHGIDDHDGALRARIEREFVAAIRAHVDAHGVRQVPGAGALLEVLRRAPAVRVAIATGGWRDSARLKLEAADIDLEGIVVASASDSEERTVIMRIAEERATGGVAPRRRTYFGDAAWDLRACAMLGYEFVAIGGKVPHTCSFASFVDRDAIIASLDAATNS